MSGKVALGTGVTGQVVAGSPVRQKPPLRLAFIVNALQTGGAEIQTVVLAKALKDLGHECLLIPLLKGEEIDRQGLEAEPVGKNGLLNPVTHRRLAATLDRYAPDLVVAVNGRPASCAQLARLIGGACRRPVATIYHTTSLFNLRQKLQHAAHLPFINRSDVLVFVSENQRAHCARFFMQGRRTETIHNGVDLTRFNIEARGQHREVMRARLGIRPDEYVIGQSAAFRPEKNHLQSLRALAALRSRGAPVRLLLLGDGPGRAEIEALAESLGLASVLLLAGRQRDVVPWISAFDVGILTSTAIETFSLAALEFMGMGIPAVLSDTGGASEMVTNGINGWIFPVNDTANLTSALERLSDPAVRARMGAAAAARVAESFALEQMVCRYEELFLETAGRV